MSTLRTPYDDPALGGQPIARDQARELLGQVMGYVAVRSDSPRSAPTSEMTLLPGIDTKIATIPNTIRTSSAQRSVRAHDERSRRVAYP
jgi:hypothetical protein